MIIVKFQNNFLSFSSMTTTMDKRTTASNHCSMSMPKLTQVEYSVPPSKPFREQFIIEEGIKEEEEDESKRGRRKFGVFLTGSALGGIASTFWTYGQLKQQQVQTLKRYNLLFLSNKSWDIEVDCKSLQLLLEYKIVF